ncbi:MAG: siderophore-interacting protein [Pseudomonadota bacterium]
MNAQTINPSEEQAHAFLRNVTFSGIRNPFLKTAQARGLEILTDAPHSLSVRTMNGVVTVWNAAATGTVRIDIAASDRARLFIVKEGVLDQLGRIVPYDAAQLRWSDSVDTIDRFPPNFQIARIVRVVSLCDTFKRVRLACGDLSAFDDRAIHLRFALPRAGIDEIIWPYVGNNGAAVWPKGDATLHRPVYTARSIDHLRNELDIDVFLHDGGRITGWIEQGLPDHTIGLTGPGGQGIPSCSNITMFGDETAFPAMARILETLPANVQGTATFCAHHATSLKYPVPDHASIEIIWHHVENGASMADLASHAFQDGVDDRFVWFAGEKNDAAKIRTSFAEARGEKKNSYIAGYWSADS